MRIIGGEFRGRRLKGPGSKNTFTRPMLDRVRESLFNILSDRVLDTEVIDLCAGTGSIGLEALSRGAKFCLFIEKSSQNVRTISHNINSLQVEGRSKIVKGELPKALKQVRQKFDLVLFDPPFALALAEETVPELIKLNLLNPGAIVVVERSKLSEDLAFSQLSLESKRIIGDSVLWIFNYDKN
ncbi:MAG TPA: 16S rRNA (guanine(966)-N(2))-methyltransferase RsmD [Oligoflexia bacterium]|nr:16S rRNA (guanine(966)-N(2))-methyltransferase RsmD [Oligoflexia bacterium]HMR23756.1 16S rRNA (guanine(966)-N(2))-methyltransferase RsmD [Oligoflexia bacterium]